MIMINNLKFSPLLLVAALLGCQDGLSSDGGMKAESRPVESPYILGHNGAKLHYFEYMRDDYSLWGDGETELAVFVYPILDSRNRGVALPHMPSQSVESLFGEELFGRQFSVVVKDGMLLVDNFPISRPVDLKAGSRWKMTYAKTSFSCKVKQQIGADFMIECASNGVELNHLFNNARGFVSYQDLCDKRVCTYNLGSSVGLLSPYHLNLLR